MRPLSAVILLVLFACDLPRDAGDTLKHVQAGTLRAGAVLHPPWVSEAGEHLNGIDVRLVELLARNLGAHTTWVEGTESALITALKNRELDIVVGGLPADAAWKKEVGATRPYYTDSTVALVAPAGKLKGMQVHVASGDLAGMYVRKKGGQPVPVRDLKSAPGAVAGSAWQLDSEGRRSTAGILLHKTPRIMAVAPGENAWLMRVDRDLQRWKDSVPQWLRGLP
jgi:polar amino acid transport system substrate-binding protein